MQYEKHFDEAKSKIQEAIESALNKIGVFVVAESQLRTPVGVGTPAPGTLRRSQTFEVDVSNKVVYVGTTEPAYYGEYVEFGTSKQKAQPFLTPAVMDNIDTINKIAQQELEKVGDS